MSTSGTNTPADLGQARFRLEPGREVVHEGSMYSLLSVDARTSKLQAGEVRIDVATSDLLCEQLELEMTSADPAALSAPVSTGRTKWLRATRGSRLEAVEWSYVVFQMLTGYATGGPITGEPDERWEPFWELTSLHQRAIRMSAEIAADPNSKRRLGCDTISERQLRRHATRFSKKDFDPSSLLDLRFTDVNDPNMGLTDDQRSVIDTALRQKGMSSYSKKALNSIVRMAFAQHGVEEPRPEHRRRYVNAAIKKYGLEKTARQRKSIESRPIMSWEELVTLYAGQYVEVDEWRIDLVGSVLGVVLRDLRVLVAIDVHTRAILAIEVTIGTATIEQVLGFLFRVLTPVSHNMGRYPVPADLHVPVPENLIADLDELLDSRQESLPHVAVDTVVTDQGVQFRSRHVTAVLERMMVTVIGMPPARPTGKPHVEAFFARLKEFVSLLPGFTGGTPNDRGSNHMVEKAGVVAPHEIQDVFVRFALAYNRAEHEGLPRLAGTTRHMSPLEMLADSSSQRGCIETLAPQVVPYWFLPVVEKKIGSTTFRHQHYTFDSPLFDDLRGTKHWFHYSKVDPTKVFMFHPGLKRWIMVKGRATTDAIKKRQRLDVQAIEAALDAMEWHSISDHNDLIVALASAYAIRPELGDELNRRNIAAVWRLRDHNQLLEMSADSLDSSDQVDGEPLLESADWAMFTTEDAWKVAAS